MGRIVGIDLGTTYSCVAIPEERTGEGFLTVRECPGCSVVLDKLKRRITPSVVAEDEAGKIVVGYSAKGRAGLFPEPIMFSKRFMGEDVAFQLGRQGTLRPEEAAAHVLRYMKELAEARLGEPVDEAVITVPAYFTLRAKQMTEKAGEKAGLKVAQIAQEPVAAALMYCCDDPRDPLRIMTYDLGGGTFDVAILEKKDGTISSQSILAFDGDRFLGGYDFDTTLALWMIDRLNEAGYTLDPSDKVSFAKLLVLAEHAKRSLSKEESYEFAEHQTNITDRNGNPVAIEMGITRDEFESMIHNQIEHTIDICHRAMREKANPPIRQDQIDEIIMVGGSSRIPLVPRRLELEFGKKPKLIEPDLCVALGAAILASPRVPGVSTGCLVLDRVPAETDLEDIAVTGRVMTGGELRHASRCVVALRSTDGAYNSSRKTKEDGVFSFGRVPLQPGGTREFLLIVTSPAGKEVASHRFTVLQSHEARPVGLVEPVTNVLAKSIVVRLVDGDRVVAPERTPLPYDAVLRAEVADRSGKIRIPVFEEKEPLGEILMTGLPETLNIGTPVEVHLSIQENYQIRGRAYVPSIAQEVTAVIDIPKPVRRSIEELRRDLEDLIARAGDAKASAGRGALFGGARVKRLDERIRACTEMLSSRAKEPLKIQDCLYEIETLIRQISAGWRPEPPHAVFEELGRNAEETLKRVIEKHPEVAKDGYEGRLNAIREEGEKAYKNQNEAAWREANEKLVRLCDELEEREHPDRTKGTPPPPGVVVVQFAQMLGRLDDWAKREGRYEEVKDKFVQAAASLKKIDPNAPDAHSQIRDWYFTRYEPLLDHLKAPKPVGGLEGLLREAQASTRSD